MRIYCWLVATRACQDIKIGCKYRDNVKSPLYICTIAYVLCKIFFLPSLSELQTLAPSEYLVRVATPPK